MHFRRLLESMVADAHRTLTDLPLSTDDEQSLVLASGEGQRLRTAGLFPSPLRAHAAATPNAVALVWGDERLSYAELNRQANRLAHYLRERGVVPDSIVGLYFERRSKWSSGMLAVMKAGGGYLPLDTALPRERLAVILSDAAPALVLTQQRLADDVPFDAERTLSPRYASRTLVQPNPLPISMAAPSRTNLIRDLHFGLDRYAQRLRHRSTGASINAYLGWEAAYGLSHMRNYLQMANFAFDVFTADFVRAFGSGGKLVLCPTETLLDPEKLVAMHSPRANSICRIRARRRSAASSPSRSDGQDLDPGQAGRRRCGYLVRRRIPSAPARAWPRRPGWSIRMGSPKHGRQSRISTGPTRI